MNPRRSLGWHIAALAVAGVVAYWVYSEREQTQGQGTVVLDANHDRLTKLTFENGPRRLEAVKRLGGSSGWMLTVSEQKTDQNQTRTETMKYRANDEFEKAVEKVLPLRAERVLPTPDAQQQKQYGLDSERRLRLELGGQSLTLIVGNETFGNMTTYLRQEPNGLTFLLSASVVRAFDVAGQRYLERRLVSIDKKDIARLVLTAQKESRTLLHAEIDKIADGDTWADQATPNQPSELYKNWMAKVFQLQVAEYLSDEPALVPMEVMKIEFDSAKDTLDTIEMASTKAPDGKTDYLARSRFTGGWVKLVRQTAEGVVADLPSMVGAADKNP
jgi:Domain of unknown function (DUF4340)